MKHFKHYNVSVLWNNGDITNMKDRKLYGSRSIRQIKKRIKIGTLGLPIKRIIIEKA